ncbi:MAG: DUF805 domain-containing protein [Sulfitobacter sp.]
MADSLHMLGGWGARLLRVNGRMSHRTFWRSYVLWQPIALLLTWTFAPSVNDFYFYPKLYCLYAICLLPLFAAGAQRLQDSGEPGQQILYPLAPYGILLCAIFLLPRFMLSGTAVVSSIPEVGAQILGAGFAYFTIAYGIIFYLLFVPLFLIATIATFMITSTIMGQCMVPSDSHPNAFGPNPNEVTQ